MKRIILKTYNIFLQIILFIGSPFTLLSSIWMKFIIKAGIGKVSDNILMQIGVLPVLDHYYQPIINPKKHLTKSLREDRKLQGINFNSEEQLTLLSKFNYNKELLEFPLNKQTDVEYFYNNDSYDDYEEIGFGRVEHSLNSMYDF